MPQFFVTIWRFVCRFLDKATQRKMRIVMSEEQKQEFIREVGEDVLPEEYGGRAKLVLLQDVAVNY
uniref:SEC14 cytosolic factor / phosphoglyceride transfer family protein n=1 Tax=Solanum tuberosum TaxID=4113 RepID=M1C344_SOLTU